MILAHPMLIRQLTYDKHLIKNVNSPTENVWRRRVTVKKFVQNTHFQHINILLKKVHHTVK